ncbi:MAG: MMPL family transporter [Pirellulaceae bacterium]|nr:MMPL family transporter [Pirellulaceae bacterium]
MLSLLDRWSRRAVICMMLLLPAILYGAVHIPVGSAGVHEWLPDGRQDRERYERFLKEFGSDQFLLISWEGCQANDPRLPAFVAAIELEDQRQSNGDTSQRLISSVQSSVDVVHALTSPPLNLPLRVAVTRLKGILVGRDNLCAIVATATPYALKHQAATIDCMVRAADRVPELGHDRLRIAGTVYEANAVDVAAERSLRQLVIPSMVIGIALACICLRSALAAMAVLVMAGVGTLLAITVVSLTGGQFSAVLIVLPTLVFRLTLSSAVHLMHYYVEASASHTDHLGSRAMLLGFKPSLLSSVTTALGMASLVASQLAPVREFGIYSSVSLCIATMFLLLAFPALADWFYARRAVAVAQKKRETLAQRALTTHNPTQPEAPQTVAVAAAEVEARVDTVDEFVHQAEQIIVADTHAPTVSPLALRYTAWMQSHSTTVSACGLGLIVLSFIGLSYLQPSTKFDDMFPVDSPTIRDMRWLEENLGPIASVEILLRFANDSPLDTYDRALWVDRVCEGIRSDSGLGAAMSATTFLPELPRTGALRDVALRSILRGRLDEVRPMLEQGHWVAQSETDEVWRVTAKVSATSDEDYGILTQRVIDKVAQVAEMNNQSVPFKVEITGLYPVMHSTQLSLIDDLQISFTAAFILITPVMMLIARGFWAGLLIMVPNVLPETVVFGMMAWLGFRLDIAGLLTASVAMGIAVNDTLHFVNWYARRLAAGDSRTQAVADTLSSCAAAMFHTMLISCCSMLPFLFADFLPTRQFAFLMIAMLSSAILGDLVLLPALLLSPLGRCVLPRARRSTSQPVASHTVTAGNSTAP